MPLPTVTGHNNPAKQVSKNAWNAVIDAVNAVDDEIDALKGQAVTPGDKGDITVGPEWTINEDVISAYGRTLTGASTAALARGILELGPLATGTDAANLTGTISASRIADASLSIAKTSGLEAALDAPAIKYAKRDFGVAGDGTTDDYPAIAAMAVYAKANPEFEYRFTPGMQVALTSQSATIDWGAARVRMRGAKFLCAPALSAGSNYHIIAAGGDWDDFNVKFTGGAFERFLVLQGRVGDLPGARLGRIKLSSPTPIGTRNDNFDAAVRLIAGDAVSDDHVTADAAASATLVWADVSIERLETSNIRYPFASRISGVTTFGWHIGSIKVRGYYNALLLYNTRGATVDNFDIQLKATGAGADPGVNAILMGGVQDMSIGSGIVADAGEHNIRIGGSIDGTVANHNIAFGHVISKRAGQCGFKVWASAWTDGLTVASLTAIDCAYDNTLGTNEDGIRLEQVRNASFGPVVVKAQDRAESSYDGIFISGSQNVSIPSAVVSGCARNALRIQRMPTGSTSQAINRININLLASDCAEEAVVVDLVTLMGTDDGLNTTTEGVHISVSATDTKGIYWRASTAAGCSVKGEVRNLVSGLLFDINSLPIDLDVLDVASNTRFIGTATHALSFLGTVAGINATEKLGYTSGAGGQVTQATSKSTAVTLNRLCGQIIMNAAALAANTTVTFTLNCTESEAKDVVIVNHASNGTFGAYNVDARAAAGSITFALRNLTAGALSEAVVLRYAIVKGVTA